MIGPKPLLRPFIHPLLCLFLAVLAVPSCGPGLRISRKPGGAGGGGGLGSVVGKVPGPFNKAQGFNLDAKSVAVAGSRVFFGGSFGSSGRNKASGIAAFNGNSVDTVFLSGEGFDNRVWAVAFAGDGSGDVYVGGDFTYYNGASNVNRITRLNSDGSIDAAFNIGAGSTAGLDSRVLSVASAADVSGDVYVGGNFVSYNGTSNVNRIARLNSNGSIDAAFNTGAGATAGFDSQVYSIAPATDASGDVYVGGDFSTYNGTSNVNRITRLNADGTIDAGFNTGVGASAGFNFRVAAIAVATDASGDVYVGGNFTSYNGASNVNKIVRLNSDGSIDSGFNIGAGATAGINFSVYSVAPAVDGSGDVYVGGFFTSYNGTPNLNNVVRLNSDGSVDATFNIGSGSTAGFNSYVYSFGLPSDGTGDVYVAGEFTSYNGTSNVNYATRLESNGSIDLAFNPPSEATSGFRNLVFPFTYVSSIALAGDGTNDIYAGGYFTTYNGTANLNYIARLNADGLLDGAFNIGSGATAGFNGAVSSVAAASDGSGDVYVGGGFSSYNGVSNVRNFIRLNANGSIDAAFDIGTGPTAGFNGTIYSVAVVGAASDDVYVGGFFNAYNGTSNINNITRLNSDGSIDAGFDIGSGPTAGFNSTVFAIALANDGTGDVYVGGQFTSYNSSFSPYVIRLNSDGSVDTAFNVGSGFNTQVSTIAPAGDGTGDVYFGGSFTSYDGTPNVNRIVRLNSDGSLDAGFNTGVGAGAGFDSTVSSIAIAKDGASGVYVGGQFTSYNGTPYVNYLTRLSTNGSLDSAFNSGSGPSGGFNGPVYNIVPLGDSSGTLYVGGWFSLYNGITHSGIALLSNAGLSF